MSLPPRPFRSSIPVLALLALSAACSAPPTKMADASMEPTIANGSDVAVTRTVAPIHRGDIIVFHSPKDPATDLVRRVAGLPGESITLIAGHLYIDNREIDEPYVAMANKSYEMITAEKIPLGRYYVMGDNRKDSKDSRDWGPIAEEAIVAKVVSNK
jgi:signal peptidase I